jgi:hypothetical protein
MGEPTNLQQDRGDGQIDLNENGRHRMIGRSHRKWLASDGR